MQRAGGGLSLGLAWLHAYATTPRNSEPIASSAPSLGRKAGHRGLCKSQRAECRRARHVQTTGGGVPQHNATTAPRLLNQLRAAAHMPNCYCLPVPQLPARPQTARHPPPPPTPARACCPACWRLATVWFAPLPRLSYPETESARELVGGDRPRCPRAAVSR